MTSLSSTGVELRQKNYIYLGPFLELFLSVDEVTSDIKQPVDNSADEGIRKTFNLEK